MKQKIYIIQCNEYVKIGVSNGVTDRRIRELQSGNPYKIILLNTFVPIIDAYKYEQQLHKRYKEYRVRGEWFELPIPLLNELLTETKSGIIIQQQNISKVVLNNVLYINNIPENKIKIYLDSFSSSGTVSENKTKEVQV